jgi:hypothetical protein
MVALGARTRTIPQRWPTVIVLVRVGSSDVRFHAISRRLVAMTPLEVVVFAHGMANFGHNRGVKSAQESLLRDRLDSRHELLGIFDDSGNYAFRSVLSPELLRGDVLRALRGTYDIRDVIIVPRSLCLVALRELEQIARGRYGSSFNEADYAVHLDSKRWRLGLVFIDAGSPVGSETLNQLCQHEDQTLRVLSARCGVVGVLKYDQGPKRIPWGAPALSVAKVLERANYGPIATGRSARTVRGILRSFLGPVVVPSGAGE